MNTNRRFYSLADASEATGLEVSVFTVFIRQEWIQPGFPDGLDDEDIARIRLIVELREKFGVNDEAVPIILHLADQLYLLKSESRSAS